MKVALSAFADEATDVFSEQLIALKQNNVPYIELRFLDGKSIVDVSIDEAKSYKQMMDDAGIKAWAIGSPLGKIKVDEDFDVHLEKAKHVFRLAQIFGTDKIRMFSFFTEDCVKDRGEVLRKLNILKALADEFKVKLYHENEKDIYGAKALECKDILDNVHGINCVFDPANFVQVNQPVGEALEILQNRIGYYHIKDAMFVSGAVVPAGKGEGELDAVVKSISQDTTLTVEPHLTVFTAYSSIDSSELKTEYVFESRMQAFCVAVNAIKEILIKNGYKEEGQEWIK